MKQTLNLKLSQHLSLTPQLRQSLRLLQLSSLDLEHEIQETIDCNPLLERIETHDVVPTSMANNAVDEHTATHTPEEHSDINWQEAFESKRLGPQNNHNIAEEQVEFSQFVSKQETLLEHLAWQIQMTMLSDKDKTIANTLLHSLDADGYLPLELEEISALIEPQLDIEIDEIQAVLSLIKTLEPLGVGAKNLAERLGILLNQLPADTSGLMIAKQIVEQHLDLLGKRNINELKRRLSGSETEVIAGIQLITQLNPRITNAFKQNDHDYIIPDIIVKKVDQHWHAELNPDNQHKLGTNQTYINMLKNNIDKEHGDYIQQNLADAKTFIKSLMNRYDTLLLVAQAITERQQAFFEQGETQMRPMVLQDIAQQLELHESTISRATAGKYMLCPRGVYELKYFFSSALNNIDGNDSSSTAIRSLIKTMIDHESKKKPLSDNKITQELENQGHIIARRTVAKYREGMNIPSSSQRKSLI